MLTLPGLGKTVEAIALILLNRHPLSNKRDLAAVIQVAKKAEVSYSSPVAAIAPASKPRPKSKLKIPIIDLATDLDLAQNPAVLEWWQKEKESFKTATTYDKEAEIQVDQVAVRLHANLRTRLTNRRR